MSRLKTIYVQLNPTKGVKTPKEATAISGRFWLIKKLFHVLSWYELIWYAVFIISGVLCLTLIPFSFTLLTTVLSLFIYMFALNFIARGKLIGLFISIFSSLIYITICILTDVWGEVITNVLIYIPMDIWAIYNWRKLKSDDADPKKQTLAVTRSCISDWWFYLSFSLLGTIGLGLFLRDVLHQTHAFLNSSSIFFALSGTFLRNNGKIESWYFNLISDGLMVALWIYVSFDIGFSTIPYALSSLCSMFSSGIGLIVWEKLYKRNLSTTGEYLAKSRKKINNIIVLKRQMQNLKWKSASDENWHERCSIKKQNNKENTSGNRN